MTAVRSVLAELQREAHGHEPGRLTTHRVEIYWNPGGIHVVEPELPPWRLDERVPARVQLSRAERVVRPGWLQRVLAAAGEHTEYTLHAELRSDDGRRRLALRARCDEARLAGLPRLRDTHPADVEHVELPALLALLHAVLAHGGRLVHVAPAQAPPPSAALVADDLGPRLEALLRERDAAWRERDRARDAAAGLRAELEARDRALEWLSLENERLAADLRAIEATGGRCPRCGQHPTRGRDS